VTAMTLPSTLVHRLFYTVHSGDRRCNHVFGVAHLPSLFGEGLLPEQKTSSASPE
jgi:hypothetical protein